MPRRRGVQVFGGEIRRAALSHEFGQSLAARWFGATQETIASQFGTYSRGPRKGSPKGTLVWVKITEGGWSHEFQCVIRPGQVFAAMLPNDTADRLVCGPLCDAIRALPSLGNQNVAATAGGAA